MGRRSSFEVTFNAETVFFSQIEKYYNLLSSLEGGVPTLFSYSGIKWWVSRVKHFSGEGGMSLKLLDKTPKKLHFAILLDTLYNSIF